MTVFVANESGMPLESDGFADLLRFAIADLGVHPQAEVSLLAVDVQSMSDLHEQWMDEPGPTDVLSFPMDELTERGSWRQDPAPPGPALLGDIVVCPEYAVRQAAERGHPFRHEMNVLVVHGLLHLLGYDHAEPDDEQAMFGKQDTIVARFEGR